MYTATNVYVKTAAGAVVPVQHAATQHTCRVRVHTSLPHTSPTPHTLTVQKKETTVVPGQNKLHAWGTRGDAIAQWLRGKASMVPLRARVWVGGGWKWVWGTTWVCCPVRDAVQRERLGNRR